MPDPHEIKEEEKESKLERRALRWQRRLARILYENRPDQDVFVTHINLLRRDSGWLLVIKGVEGITKKVMFRDVFYLDEFMGIAVEAIEGGKWRNERPYVQ